ncbi:BQ2448_4735 [Microbotryum intermedium]|uniref:BQ2448_4735 protein n=1 Tax=Microbotryum intermedium TaxID=269621 RepID=A0A238FIR4_9BASI|nr:BQ2448_4735 [Microbotryum intermedium]
MLIRYSASTPAHLEPEQVSLALSDISTAIAQARSAIVMLGAGASTNAGIADFRSKSTGLYSRQSADAMPSVTTTTTAAAEAAHAPFSDEALSCTSCSQSSTSTQTQNSTQADPTPTQLRSFFTSSSFRDPSTRVRSLKFFASFKTQIDQILEQGPSRGVTSVHRFSGELKAIERLRRVYSQNIDGFETSGGLTNVELGVEGGVERDRGDKAQLHGTVSNARCSECDHSEPCGRSVVEQWARGEMAECRKCQARMQSRSILGKRALRPRSYLRPSIVLYDETIPYSKTIARLANQDISQIDCLLVCGTSLRIGGFVKMVKSFGAAVRSRGGLCVLVNRETVARSWDEVFDYHVMADCDDFVERIKAECKASDPKAWKGVKKRQRAFLRSTLASASTATEATLGATRPPISDLESRGPVSSFPTKICFSQLSDRVERRAPRRPTPTKKKARRTSKRLGTTCTEVESLPDEREAREIALMAEMILKKEERERRRKRMEKSCAGGGGGRVDP